MEPRFSAFEANLYGLRIILDHIRIFIFAALAKIAVFFCYFLLFGVIGFGFFHSLWNLRPQFEALLTCSGVEACKTSALELWSGLSPLLLTNFIMLLLFFIFLIILAIAIYLGFIRIVLVLHDTGRSSVRLLFSCFGLVPKALIAGLIYAIMVTIGTVLLIIPGIYLALRLAFFSYFIVDKNAGIIDSLNRSFKATENHGWRMLGLVVLLPSIALIPGGVFFLMPFTTAIMVYAYRKLTA